MTRAKSYSPDPHIERRELNQGTAGPNHIGIEAEDASAIYEKLKQRGIRTYAEEQSDRPRFFKFRDPSDVGVDAAPSQIPGVAEPFFIRLDAEVDFYPVMNAEEPGRALPAAVDAVRKYK